MSKSLLTIIATLAVLAVGAFVFSRAEAGGSQSAPLKVRTQNVASTVVTSPVATRNRNFGISEFSASSATRR
jgi:cytochrome c oxidase assembly factor CtaG